ncbi:hypothetical protein METP3_01549 [Methanosarcinales archaeon]|nr:hypothetical protein METP3_01549 [Methanosarcinales archaeon]
MIVLLLSRRMQGWSIGNVLYYEGIGESVQMKGCKIME